MSRDSDYIIILCGVFQDGYNPLTRAGFWKLYHKYGNSIEALIHSGEQSIEILLKRSASVTFAREELLQKGIRITTFHDSDFPKKLFDKLGDFCPPLFYTCGNPALYQMKTVGYVGSRKIDEQDIFWTQKMVEKNYREGFGVVTGGANGIDSIALTHMISLGGFAVVFLPNNMNSKIKDSFYQKSILNGKLLLYSHISPYTLNTRNVFVAAAMERNKFIYSSSSATVVVRSEKDKGGTWTGATESLRHKWAYIYVWDQKEYAGNQKLIEMGAVPLSDEGKIVKTKTNTIVDEKSSSLDIKQVPHQTSIEEYLNS